MRLLQLPPRNSMMSAMKNKFHSGHFLRDPQVASRFKLCSEELMSKLLDRRWRLTSPDTKVHQIIIVSDKQIKQEPGSLGNLSFLNNPQPPLGDRLMENNDQQPAFYVVRDDLLHPLVNGNKARKLDALLPLIEDHSVTDVVTCGGCQSAHTAAVGIPWNLAVELYQFPEICAVSCAERGLKSHLLLRGEQPETLTGYNLISTLYGDVAYIPRSLYAKRDEMLARHADLVAGNCGSVLWLSDLLEGSAASRTSWEPDPVQMHDHDSIKNMKKVVIINEGAGDAAGLLGVIRLVQYLSQDHLLGKQQALKIVVDAGTGTTAVGLGLGAKCLGLPWEVTAVMLAATIDEYKNKEHCLISQLCRSFPFPSIDQVLNTVKGGIVHWVERNYPRKFGNVLPGEVESCQRIAQQTGILVDPVYTLSAWELATQLTIGEEGCAKVVLIHTGGTMGMFGLAQRYNSYFGTLKDELHSRNISV